MKHLKIIFFLLIAFAELVNAKAYEIEGVITKEGDTYMVLHSGSDKPVSIAAFVEFLKSRENGSMIGLALLSEDFVPISQIQSIIDGASKNPLIEILDIRLGPSGKLELERRKK